MLAPWSRLREKSVDTFSVIHSTRMLITVFTRARLSSPLSAGWIQSTASPYFLKNYFNIVVSFTGRLPRVPFPSGFPIKISYAFVIAHLRATCPVHLPWFGHPNILWSVQIMKLLIMVFIHRLVTPSFLDLKVFNILFSSTKGGGM
jgi:hypothetical protein